MLRNQHLRSPSGQPILGIRQFTPIVIPPVIPPPNPLDGGFWGGVPWGGGGGGGGRRHPTLQDGPGRGHRRDYVLSRSELQDLPDELLRVVMTADESLDDELELPDEAELDDSRLHLLGITLGGLRDEAVKARAESGIENVWVEAEDSYLCIDDLNRHEFGRAQWAKPVSMNGPLRKVSGPSADGRSTVFVRLTPRYVDMGSAKVCEKLLPIDDRAFSLSPTPIPALVDRENDPTPIRPMAPPPPGVPMGAFGMLPQGPMPGMSPQGPQPPMPPGAMPGMPPTVGDLAKAIAAKAKTASDKAEQRIYDWMQESNYPAEVRKVVHDAARIGVGVLKGPFPETRKAMAMSKTDDGAIKITRESTVSPACRWIDPWNLFPHPACGESIHEGDWIWERGFLTDKTLRDMKSQRDSMDAEVYLPAQIDKVLREGPGKVREEGRNPNEPRNKDRYEVWYFYGVLNRRDFLLGRGGDRDELPDELEDVFTIATIVNDTVIRLTRNPLHSGRFPFNVMPWSRRAGSWAGVGVAEQVRMPQQTVNAGTRAVLNNAGVSAGVQIVLDPLGIEPADGSFVLTPNKFWWKKADATSDDVRKMFAAIEFPNMTAQLMPIVQYAFKLAEEASNIPLISQGQDSPEMPQTLGGLNLQDNNGNTLLRNIAHLFDDNITEPLVRGLYEWLLLDPNVPEDEKGDFQINAKGSISMIEKSIQEQALLQMGAMVINPVFGIDPAKWIEEALKAKGIDPRRILMSEEEKAKRAQAMPPPEAPQVTAAKLRLQFEGQREQMRLAAEQQTEAARAQQAQMLAQLESQTRLQAAQMTTDATLQKMRADTDRDTIYANAEAARTQTDNAATMATLQLKRELALLDYANKRELSLSEVKADLAKQAMSIQATKELAAMEVSADRLPKPPIEPAGRARRGRSFQE